MKPIQRHAIMALLDAAQANIEQARRLVYMEETGVYEPENKAAAPEPPKKPLGGMSLMTDDEERELAARIERQRQEDERNFAAAHELKVRDLYRQVGMDPAAEEPK